MAKVKYLGTGSMHTQDILFKEGEEEVEVTSKQAKYIAENFGELFEITEETPPQVAKTKEEPKVETPKKRG
jgi:hypothetical protein